MTLSASPIADLGALIRRFAAGLRPDAVLTVSEWADKNVVLTSSDSSERGPFRTSRTPYIREPIDCLSSHSPVRKVVLMFGTQLGKTRGLLNWIGYIVDQAPGPILMVQPTIAMAKKVSKQRLAPMIQSTAVLRGRIRDARSRDAGNTMFEKEFDGGILMLTGANSAASLASMPIANLALDEVDRYPEDVDEEGSPIALAEERAANFRNGKTLVTSTPLIKGESAIEKQFLMSDQRRYYIPCPHCGHMDYIQWRRGGLSGKEGTHHSIEWDEGDPETARMLCASCDGRVEEHHKDWMLARGEWRPTAPGNGKIRGYHLPSMYSPLGWKSWASLVQKFLETRGKPKELKTFVNTTLAETWEERHESVEPDGLLVRCERYVAEVPPGVRVLTAAIDVQADRLECKVKGWGVGEESWLIAYHQEYGDVTKDGPWQAIDAMLSAPFEREQGPPLRVRLVAVDTNYQSDVAYRQVGARFGRGWRAVRGGNTTGIPLVGKPRLKSNRYRQPLWTLCTDTGKELIYSRLGIQEPGPGYMHFPEWADKAYFEQLTAEVPITKRIKGRGSFRIWQKIRDRNEAFDLENYCLAALYMLGETVLRALGIRSKSRAPAPIQEPAESAEGADAATTSEAAADAPAPPPPPPPAVVPGPPQRHRRPGWVNSWRRRF